MVSLVSLIYSVVACGVFACGVVEDRVSFVRRRRGTGRRIVSTGLASLVVLLVVSCGTVDPTAERAEEPGQTASNAGGTEAPQTEEPQTEEPQTVPEDGHAQPGAAAGSTGESQADASTPLQKAPDFVFVSPSETFDANLEMVRETMRVFRLSRHQRTPVADARRRAESALRELAELYKVGARTKGNGANKDNELGASEHFELCKTLTSVQRRSQQAVYEAGVEHCEAVIETLEAGSGNVRFLQALSTMAESQFRFGDYDAALAGFDLYLEIACNDPPENESAQGERYRTAFCKRTLTHYLPALYHKLGNLDELTALQGRLTKRGLTDPRLLRTLSMHLVEDLWHAPTLRPLTELCAELEKTAKVSSPLRDVLPLVLSTRARLGMLSGDCNAGRRVYLDHDWNHPAEQEKQPTWHLAHVGAPQRLLCYPAPSLAASEWIEDKEPGVLPGGDSPLAKPVLLHFFKPSESLLDEHASAMATLAEQYGEDVQFVGVVPRATFCYDATEESSVSALDPVGFHKALAAFVGVVGIRYPVGVLNSLKDPSVERYAVVSYPTLVLIDTSNTVVAYHTSLSIDAGWGRCLKAVTNP